MTARKFRLEGFGDKTELDLTDRRLRERGLSQAWVQVREIRALWAALANRALARAGHEARIYSREGRGARCRSPLFDRTHWRRRQRGSRHALANVGLDTAA